MTSVDILNTTNDAADTHTKGYSSIILFDSPYLQFKDWQYLDVKMWLPENSPWLLNSSSLAATFRISLIPSSISGCMHVVQFFTESGNLSGDAFHFLNTLISKPVRSMLQK